jgi:hypothetical protein
MHLRVQLLLVSLIHFACARRGGGGGGGSSGRKSACDIYAAYDSIVTNETGVVLLDDDDYDIRVGMNNSGVVDLPCELRTAPPSNEHIDKGVLLMEK